MSNTLQGLIEHAREAAATVAEADAIRKRAESLPGLVREAGRLDRAAAISAELSDVLPGLQTQIAALQADCAGWRHSRDALAAQAELLAARHVELQARRIELDRMVNVNVVNELAVRFPPNELEPARAIVNDLWRTANAGGALATVIGRYVHAATIGIDQVIDFISRSRRA